MTVNNKDNPENRTTEQLRSSETQLGFGDLSGTFPRPDYFFDPTINKAARGVTRNELNFGGGDDGISVDLAPQAHSQYPLNDVKETLSGHIVEYDDTPGGERILIKHRSGSGVELRADGSMVMKTENNLIHSIAGESAIIVEGDGTLTYNGNLNLNVSGDMNITVGGNINTSVGGNTSETISGSKRDLVYGTRGSVVKGDRSTTTVGTHTEASLSGKNDIVKGNMRHTIDGNSTYSVSGSFKQTASGSIVTTSPTIDIGAQSLAVFGASGTVGGAGVVHYGSTFHGDLKGTAEQAITADVTNSQNYGEASTGSASGYSVTNSTTAEPTSSIMDAYVNQSSSGAPTVSVDPDDNIMNRIDRTVDNGGLSDRTLNTTETRSILRDDANWNNEQFIGNAVSSGVISNSYTKTVPSQLGRMSNSFPQTRTPTRSVPSTQVAANTRFKPNKNKKLTSFVPNASYDLRKISDDTPINGKVMLESSIPLSKFLGAKGDKVTMDHIETREEKLAIARNFSLHARVLRDIQFDKGEFKDHRLVVVEGLYKPGPEETPTTDSVNDLATKGRAVVYELRGPNGQIDPEKTYDLALYWKDTINFDSLILNYDTLNPDETLTTQLILTMPELKADYTLATRYKNNLQTKYNGAVQGNELIEVINT